jgi:ribosomal protein L40E
MNTEFTAVVQKLIAEQGREVLFNAQRCKAFLADYTRGEHTKESRLLLQVLEAGAAKELVDANDLAACKQKIVRDLQEDFFITGDAAADMVNMLSFVLRRDTAKPAARKPEKSTAFESKQSPPHKSVSIRPVLEEDIIRRSLEIWICGRCNTLNDFERDFCKKCGKEFNPPMVKPNYDTTIKIRPALWEMKKK